MVLRSTLGSGWFLQESEDESWADKVRLIKVIVSVIFKLKGILLEQSQNRKKKVCDDIALSLLLLYHVSGNLASKMGSWFRNLSILVIAFIVCSQIHQSVGFLDNEDDNVERGDRYIDKLLDEMLEQNGHEYDPYVLEDSSVGFSKKVMFVNVSGEAKLHNGYITGLKSLHRPDHCSVEEEDGKLKVNADLGAGVLDFYYDGTVKFMNFGPTIKVHGVLAYMEVHMEFTVDAKTGRDGKLTKFVIDEMKGFVRGIHAKALKSSHIAERLPNYSSPLKVAASIYQSSGNASRPPEETEHLEES
ncbi:hypothetical protein AVEN_12605-1 [Araneus ventricosus]|uniref:Uncharacterized protein n=1 Tax=Araneus ventricosus TaxID=182803 RepID=A0A4Y2AC87_ARAVE|nr:hypothetical protein AVEN_12605-1 [Araneus ventricosus]